MFGKSHRWLWIFVVFLVALSFPSGIRAQYAFSSLQEDMLFLRERSEAVLFFNVFGNNPDPSFTKHRLNRTQIRQICGGIEACEKFGANFATHFQAGAAEDDPTVANWDIAENVGMDWGLQIAQQGNPGAVIDTINKRSPDFGVIVRFGTAAGGDGFKGPETIISFLQNVGNNVGGRVFYAIAGPNEPDLEPWAVDSYPGTPCGVFPANSTEKAKQDWVSCTAPRLATYMKTICGARGSIPANVRLLTPAFNATSHSFPMLVPAVKEAGGFVPGCFDGMAINIYGAGNSVQHYWDLYEIEDYDLPIYVTETGPFGTSFFEGETEEPDGFRNIPGARRAGDDALSDNYHYISPIMGLNPLNIPKDVGEIRDSLANQGYQAYCATPTYTIEQKFTGSIQEFIDNVSAGHHSPRDVPVDSTQVIDYNKAQTPIFRSTERKAYLKSDMEEFFGYRELDKDMYSQTELESAAINSLLTENQKCMKSADALVAQRTMCNKLGVAPELNCALYYPTVPGTNMSVLNLINAYEAYLDGKTDEEACHGIVAREEGVSEEFRTGMLNASLHLEEAYRIAFLVGVVRQKPEMPNPLFNFFSKTSVVPPSDEVVVISFKIPDIGTNKGTIWQTEPVTNTEGKLLYDQVARNDQSTRVETVESGHTYWDDVMTLTRNVLIPRKMAEKMDLEGSDERVKLREAAAAATGQGGGSLIYCLMGQAPFGTGSNTCNDEAVKAVVDIINGTWMYDKERVSCDPANLTNEVVNKIGDAAILGGAVDNYKFQFQYGEFILSQIWDNNFTEQEFSTVFKVNPSNWPPKDCNVLEQGQGASGDCTTINFYLVYPMGYDLETLEYVMSRTFLTEDQYEAASQDPDIKNRFTVFRDRVGVIADREREEFVDFLDCSFDENFNYRCPTKEFTATVESSQGPALFLGARVGHWIHSIQKSFNRLESLAHKYLQGCRTTEEFLLDQCGGAPDEGIFDDEAYCLARPDRAGIIRNVTNSDLSKFRFATATGQKIDYEFIDTPASAEGNRFFPKPGELGCQMTMSIRAVDGLSLILSGGKDIIPNNPGNVLGCGGRVSVNRKLRIQRLPPEYNAAQKAANPNWKPLVDDKGWDTADVLLPRGGTASEIHYDIRVTPGYYKVAPITSNAICQANHTWVMQDGKEIGTEEYVYDLVNKEACQSGACYDINLQPNTEGGGPIYKKDGEGNIVVDYVIDVVNDHHNSTFGCELSFEYSALRYNNSCGGRYGNCTLEGLYPGTEGNCSFWHDMIKKIKEGTTIGGKAGSDAYYSVYGRYPDASGNVSCVQKSDSGSNDPAFGNTIVIRNCETYTSSLDSLRVFGKIVGFSIEWFLTPGEKINFEVPSRDVWGAIQTASEKHGCDPWLVLALASSEGEESGYYNDTRPNNAQTIGIFEFLPAIWDGWIRDNNPNDAQCTWRQPSSFNEANKQGLDFSDRANIPAAVDTACRIILYSGMQKYPDDQEKFRNAFTSQLETKENNYGFGWNNNPLQADYVWEFWQKARQAAEENPRPQPAGYPYNICTGGEQPSQPVPTPPTGVPAAPTGSNNTGAPPTAAEAGSIEVPGTWKVEQWATYMNYFQRSQLPIIGYNSYMRPGAIDEVLRNRQGLLDELSYDTIHNCTLDYVTAKSRGGGTPMGTLEELKKQAAVNGRSRAIGCTASVRIGDLPFRGEIGGGKDAFRTVWVKPKNGVFTNTCIGPILVMDVANQEHLREQYHKFGSNYTLDLGYELFEFVHSGYGPWETRQELVVADTEEQCQKTLFGQQ